MTDKYNFAKDKDKDSDTNESTSDRRPCKVCGGDHNVLFIGLENGGHIITEHLFKEGPVEMVVHLDVKRKATTLDLVKLFWSVDEFQTGN